MAQKHLLIICGEASGDLHAGLLAKELYNHCPEIKISGVGGEFLRQSKAEIFCDIQDLAVIGLFDVLKKLPRFFALKKTILEKIKETKPDAIILVDFSGFNLRLARAINKGIPVIYYISPQVWASRSGRIETIKKYIHKMIVLFKFEQEFYQKYAIDADLVGHPLLDVVRPSMEKKNFLNRFHIGPAKTIIALLPGSRRQEIENILPIMLESAQIIRKKIKEAQFVIAKSPNVDWSIYNQKIHGLDLNLQIIEGQTYDCLNIADLALVASGTATLETAMMQKPFVVIYKMGLWNYLLYRPQVKLPYIGMVNIVAGRKIIPEFIQFHAKPQAIAEEALAILGSPSRLAQMQADLGQVKSSLGQPHAASRAAKIILEYLHRCL